ncbi:trichohyalin-like [Nematolebias whitei]|uniref:trichohyalin-like n=1 Tax=Nematolebias whitei TaxID=451745 RepID=UPI00189A5827|nr:trichohyalin-like [Nematolebias whitei]
MALCLVPDFPAVLLVLEHLTELDRQLKEDGVPFASKARVHLTALTAAVSELEAARRAAHEHLEVETIENGKLRHQIKNMSDRMSEEMMADAAAARESNAEEMERLRKDLKLVSHLQEDAGEKLQALLNQNKTLHPEREQVKAEHEAVIAALNEQMNLKYNLQMQLDEKLQQMEELKSSFAAVQQERTSLEQNMALQRKACSEKKGRLSREADETVERIKLQVEAVDERREEFDRVNGKKEETLGRLGELRARVDTLESILKKVVTSRTQCEQKLEEEAQRHKELSQQIERQEKESRELKEAFSVTIKNLQEQIAAVEKKMEEDRASGLLLGKSLSQMCELLKHRRDEENEVRAECVHVSQQLEWSRLQLEECIASIVVHSKDVRKMEKETEELQEAEISTRRAFERNREELRRDMESAKEKISQYEEDKRRFSQLLEEAKSRHEEHVEKMRSDISHTKRRYEELLQEEAELLQLKPKSADIDFLISYMTQTEMENRQMEKILQQKVQQISAEIQAIRRSTEEKQRELEEKEEMLKEVEATWTEMKNRHDRLTSELRWQKTELELSIQDTKNQTEFLLGQEEDLKAELEELQETRTDMLSKRSSELRAMEVSICNHSVILEQVRVENSRLHLYISRVQAARQAKEQHQQEDQKLRPKTKDTMESLREAWRQDVTVTQKSESRDDVLLGSMNSMQNRLKTREKQLMNVSAILHHKMMDFSKRVGLQATATQQI